ncbi:MAG: oligogalacturonate lyase family protein [Capsulimonadaceae bacterium]|nr:oligogalacturonate lyase family protein [Capsulimonadaceae bacterium]
MNGLTISSIRTTFLARFARRLVSAAVALTLIGGYALGAENDARMTATSWVDATTGHRVVLLSRFPKGGSGVLYFHQHALTPAGDKLVFAHAGALYSIDISNRQPMGEGTITRLTDLAAKLLGFAAVSRKRPVVYYVAGDKILATNIDTLQTRTIAQIPGDWDLTGESLAGLSANADDTLIAGANTNGVTAIFKSVKDAGGKRGQQIAQAYEAHLPTLVFTVDIATGKLTVIHRGNDWFNHVQFSPTDPATLMFAHEGPWNKVERIWNIRADGTGLTDVCPRGTDREYRGHEFWSPSGQTIWFDYFDGKARMLTGHPLSGGHDTSYPIVGDQYSVHYNISHDGSFFAADGDGGNKHPMIHLLYPQTDGTLRTEPLCDLTGHNFVRAEPNVSLSADNKWVFFMANWTGMNQVYAVSVDREPSH